MEDPSEVSRTEPDRMAEAPDGHHGRMRDLGQDLLCKCAGPGKPGMDQKR